LGTLRRKLAIPLVGVVAIVCQSANASHSTFVSRLYQYSVEVPDGFRARAATIALTPGFSPAPSRLMPRSMPAVELDYRFCFGYFDVVETVHEGRGYDLYWLGPPERGTLRRDLSSFRFTQ
jgi:hypothetical protein